MATHQIVPAICPVCRARFMAPLDTILDVGKDPSAKARLLQGQINVTQCPQCGQQAPMKAPFLYHDPAHDLALVFMPNELGLHNDDQQKIIGDMTNTLINSLPAEQRKGYLLTPQLFLNMERLTEEVLRAEGVTPETLARQKARAQLVETFLRARDEDSLRALVKEHEAELDYDFFRVMTASAQAAYQQGQAEAAQAMLGLRNLIAELAPNGDEYVAQVNSELGFGETITREKLLERLRSAESDEAFEALIAAGRPILDYEFFQHLTKEIEAATDDETGEQLKKLRSRILDTTARQDEQVREAVESAAGLLKTILQADDPTGVIRENLDKIDDMFFSVLSANIQRAREEKQEAAAQRLEQIGNIILQMIQEDMPQDVRLVNQLLQAKYPEGTLSILEEHRDLLVPEVVQAMQALAEQLAQSGQADAAQHLRQVAEQAQSMTAANPAG